MNAREKWVSVFIISMLTLQFYVGVVDAFNRWIPPFFFWPFIGYDMFYESHRSGEPFYRFQLYAILQDGTRFPLTKDPYDSLLWAVKRRPHWIQLSKDPEKINSVVRWLERKHKISIQAIEADIWVYAWPEGKTTLVSMGTEPYYRARNDSL